eukprot:scaffold4155_cov165-Amphora_coffeaeformis.AAC.11
MDKKIPTRRRGLPLNRRREHTKVKTPAEMGWAEPAGRVPRQLRFALALPPFLVFSSAARLHWADQVESGCLRFSGVRESEPLLLPYESCSRPV